MSGPKVVRIVTREEVEAVCRREIAFARAAADDLMRVYDRGGRLTPEVEQGIRASIGRLTTLLSSGRYLEVQKQAPEVAAFLKSEAERVTREAISAAETDRQRRRRLADSATSLIQAFMAAGKDVPAELSAVPQKVGGADEAALSELRTLLDRWLRDLAAVPRPDQRTSPDLEQLAARLGNAGPPVTLDQWTAANAPAHPNDARIDIALATIDALGDVELVEALRVRLEAVRAAPADRRAVLTDSLLLEASREAQRVRNEGTLRARLRQMLAGLEAIGTKACLVQAGELKAMLGNGDLSTAEGLLIEASAVSEREVAQVAADGRRRAVLSGLATLGYEVREGMATAWVRDGRIVLRKPGTADYGVEIGAPGDVSRMQVRIVGSDQPAIPRDSVRDRDQEVLWCSEVSRLQELVQQAGGALVVERAAEPGVQAVKTVTFEDAAVTSTCGNERPMRGRTRT